MDFVNDNDNPTLAEMMKKVEHIVRAREHRLRYRVRYNEREKGLPPNLSTLNNNYL